MTIAMLLRNTLVAAHRRAGFADPKVFEMLTLLLMAAACRPRRSPARSAVDAERAFARDASVMASGRVPELRRLDR